jgi:hypothetical protein
MSVQALTIHRPAGIFAFTIASLTAKDKGPNCESMPEYIEVPSAWGVPIFKHSDKYINKISEKHGLTIQKEQKVLVESGDKDAEDILFKVIVMQKTVS